MSDLGSQIRHYIDDAAPAIPLDDVQQPAPVADDIPMESPSKPRARWLVAAAVVACFAVIGATLAVRGGDTDRVQAGPGTTVPTSRWNWLDQFGTEGTAPAVPDGWQTLDFGEIRFSVPGDWVVPISRSCSPDSPSGVVLLSNGVDPQSTCGPEHELPESVLTIEANTEREGNGDQVTVGTLEATRFEAPDCVGCLPEYVLDSGYLVTVTGPEAQRVLDTFTDAGALRVLQSGEDAETSAWQSIDFEGLSMLVPPEWESLDLPASYSEQRTENGGLRISGYQDPGSCGSAMFPSEGARVFLGTSLYYGSCPSWQTMDLNPGDGIWIRSGQDASGWTEDDRGAIGVPIAHGEANGLDITIVRVDRLGSRTPSPVLDLVVRDDEQVHWISLGVGLDSSVARSILRSLGAQGEPPEGPAPEVVPTQLPEDCIWPSAGTAAFLDTLVDDALTVGFVASFESDDDSYENLFFLSAEIDGGDLNGPEDIATWASNVSGFAPTADPESGSTPSLPPYLSFVPVNDLAARISSGVGPLRVPTMETDGAVESQECLAPRPVPDLVGLDQEDAARLLEGTGFVVEVTEARDPVAAAGEVLRTDPSRETSLAPGSTVTVTVSMGPAPGPT